MKSSSDVQTVATREGTSQLAAAIALMCASKMVKFDPRTRAFNPVLEIDFESDVMMVHQHFGRVLLWILFSAGAEYLLKSSLIFSGLLKIKTSSKQGIPTKETPWTSDWLSNVPREDVKNFKTMGQVKKPDW